MGLSANMTVRYKLRSNKMAFWNEFLPSIEESVKPTTERSEVPTKSSKADDKEGMTIKSKYTKHTASISFDCMCFFFFLFILLHK